jgi:hypothetical protein
MSNNVVFKQDYDALVNERAKKQCKRLGMMMNNTIKCQSRWGCLINDHLLNGLWKNGAIYPTLSSLVRKGSPLSSSLSLENNIGKKIGYDFCLTMFRIKDNYIIIFSSLFLFQFVSRESLTRIFRVLYWKVNLTMNFARLVHI